MVDVLSRFRVANGFEAAVPALGGRDADVPGLSVTMPFNVSLAHQLARKSGEPWTSNSVIASGAAFRQAPDLWREVGADSRADAVRAAVEAMREAT